MAKIRKFVAYRRLERPFTRKSKYRAKSFVRASPRSKIVRNVMGERGNDSFPIRVRLVSKDRLQIRDNALESARQIVLRRLEKTIGKTGFRFRIRVYPHHFLRENPLAAGAGADRMSTGMKMSFGKIIGIAAQIQKEQTIFQIETSEANMDKCKTAISLARSKLPCSCQVIVEKNE